MRVAAIDIGTNSVLLLIAEAQNGVLIPLRERATITRLGQGVDSKHALDPEAISRTLACLCGYAEEIRQAGVTRLDVVGTSAMRDAKRGEEFRARAREILGMDPRVISGDEEAALTFTGALSGLSLEGHPVTVFDLGGGSTEIIRDEGRGRVAAVSLDIGSVRLTERHVRNDPPTPEELSALRSETRRTLAEAEATLGAPKAPSSTLVGVAGTVTTLAAFVHGVVPYEASRVHGAHLRADEIARARAELASLPIAERRKIAAIDSARADVIIAGCVIVEEILAWAGGPSEKLVVSDRGVRWGLAQRLIEGSTNE